jgi:hypothetical protein
MYFTFRFHCIITVNTDALLFIVHSFSIQPSFVLSPIVVSSPNSEYLYANLMYFIIIEVFAVVLIIALTISSAECAHYAFSVYFYSSSVFRLIHIMKIFTLNSEV